jgi:DNA helicase-2/ATP-dependent DNA helicase PcrA
MGEDRPVTDSALSSRPPLTDEQRRIVEAPDGPLVVIAGAGTGKTRVIVERVRWLLETKGRGTLDAGGHLIPGEPTSTSEPTGSDAPFAGPLTPEQVLVLTYNVKAARELGERLEEAVGPALRARLNVANFHSFCHRVLSESASDAGLRANPDVLDGIGQFLLLRDIRPSLPLVYHAGGGNPTLYLNDFVDFINRAKDELVTPHDFDAFVFDERRVFEERHGAYERAVERLAAQGNLRALSEIRAAYADLRRAERAEERGDENAGADPGRVEKVADREARRAVAGNGRAQRRSEFASEQHAEIDALADTYVVDGAALEVLRLSELALVYHAYQAELTARGALDFGEQIAAAIQLFKLRPNILRRYQRQFRYVLVDEFQDANVAQIELIELLGRTPDRPDNVMVVGDDDQSIYRFRGASYAAFAEFDRRFALPPAHDPGATPPGPPFHRRIEQNFRSVDSVLLAANRLIAHNQSRFEPDKRLVTERETGEPVQVVVCADAADEAVVIVDAVKSLVDPAGWRAMPDAGASAKPRWSDAAILYRKHKHREAIVARLREEDIPYTVVGGLSLFETAEIRDLEQSLRTIADPLQDVALVRMMSAGPWRLDALEILRVARMAKYDRRHLVDVVKQVVELGEVEVDRVANGGGDGAPAPERDTDRVPVDPATRARLRRLLDTLDGLAPLTWREGPFTILERFLERTGQVLDLVAAGSLESQRMVANIASFLRFAHDWQAAHPQGTLAGFVDYLDAFQGAGGELPTSVELTEDVEGVRLMTLHQAKGLEFRYVFVPHVLEGEWPTREQGSGLFPTELLREIVPPGDIHTEEERRLLYVAMTRAKDRLTITTHGGSAAEKRPSAFVQELLEGAGPELRVIDRTVAGAAAGAVPGTADGVVAEAEADIDADDTDAQADTLDRSAALVRRVMPLPTKRERRLSLRLRATEIIGLMEGTDPDNPEAAAARQRFEADLAAIGRAAVLQADGARALGLDPLTFRAIALDSAAGANLLDVAPLPAKFSYSQLDTYERCPLRYAFQQVYRIPSGRTVAAFTFGTTAHAAFEAFTKERRERLARGEAPPDRAELDRLFAAEWKPGTFGDKVAEDTYRGRVSTLLDNFWAGELATVGRAIHEELWFDLALLPDDGGPPVLIGGSIDRIDRLPSGGIEIVDYKTGRIGSQKGVDESLQLSIYALACRDALNLGTPERVTLYFTESATRLSTVRTDGQLDAARADILARVARIRSGDFAATPSGNACHWCDYAPMCPSRAR